MKKGYWKCKKSCEECEGTGEVFSGMRSIFNSKNMEMIDIDIYSPCENSEYIERDYFEYEKIKSR